MVLPTPSPEAFAFHEELFWLWLLEQAVKLAVPAWLLLSGRGAAIAQRCLALARGRPWLGTLLFAGVAGLLYALAGLAVDGVRAMRLTPYLAHRSLDLPDWLAGKIVPTLGQVAGLAVAGCLLNLIIRRSSRWWWAWVSGGVTVLASIYLMVQPLTDARMKAYPRIENSTFAEWTPRITSLLARTGATDVPVLVRKTRAGEFCPVQNSAVGLGPTRRIVLADRIFTDWTPEMVDSAVAHELKHYLFDNTWFVVALIAGLTVASAFAVRTAGNAFATLGSKRLGFGTLTEPAALPLLVLLLQSQLLITVPAFNLVAQRREMDADRFALELTRDSQARAAISASKCGDLWLTEDPLFERLYLNTHPSAAERVRLANEHRPWETGERGAYGDFLKQQFQ